jgi:CrcB protein
MVDSVWGQWLLVAAGGAVGGALRYAVTGWFSRHTGERFPWGTLAVNASGALVLGLLMGRALIAPNAHEPLWLLLGVGVIGSYTTVSSLSLQTLLLFRNGQTLRAFIYLAATLMTGLAAAAAGLWLGNQ